MRAILSSWVFWALLSASSAALTAIFGKIGVEGIGSDFATLIRTIVILPLLAFMVALSGTWQPVGSISGKTILFLVLSGIATGISWLCYYRALQLGPVSGVASVDKMSVLLVALIAFLFLGEKLMLRNWIGIGLIVIGTVLVAMRGRAFTLL